MGTTGTSTVQAPPVLLRGLPGRLRDILARPDAQAATLLAGRPVRLRFAQSLLWSVTAGFLGASFIAGLYYAVLEQHWYVHVASFNHGAGLKLWWDNGAGFVRSGNWPLYRHALRDIGEPAVATMAVRTLLAKPGYWGVRIGPARLVTAPLVVLALTFSLAAAGTWLLDFAAPGAWAHAATWAGHRGFTLDRYFRFLGKTSAGQLALGFAAGQVLHRFWAPVGATLQGFVLDRAVDRAQAPRRRYPYGRVPAWEKLPVAPPVIRERFAKMWREDTDIEPVKGAHRMLLTALVAAVAVVTILGGIAKFWIVHGHTVPYLAP